MDRKKAKKMRSMRVIATNIFMTIAVIATVAVLMLVSMGFSFSDDGLKQSGLLQIASTPSRATVTIDGDQLFSRTTINKMLSSGWHDIKISKPGYDTWQKNLNLSAGLLTHVEWVRLFPLEQNIETVANFQEPRLISYSPDRKRLLVSTEGTTNLLIYNIQDPNLKYDTINLATALNADAELASSGAIQIAAWDTSGNNVVLQWHHPDESQTITWHLVNLSNNSKPINLSASLSQLAIQQVAFANDSANKLWLRANNTLYFMDFNTNKLSAALAQNVESFYSRGGSTVVYVASSNLFDCANTTEDTECNAVPVDTNTLQRALFSFRDGESQAVELTKLNETDQVSFIFGDYWGDDWLAYNINNHIIVQSGHLPSVKQKDNQLKTVIDLDIPEFTPKFATSSPNRRIIAFSDGQNTTTLDIETLLDYSLDTAHTNDTTWVDDFLLWKHDESTITIRDFDGDNSRQIITNASSPNYAVISNNNKWLYYIETSQDQTEDEASTPKLILKRLNLNI